jgi:hypothetical protein
MTEAPATGAPASVTTPWSADVVSCAMAGALAMMATAIAPAAQPNEKLRILYSPVVPERRAILHSSNFSRPKPGAL